VDDKVPLFGERLRMTVAGGGPPVVGIDLGGTKILAGVVAGDHRVLGRAKRTTPAAEGGPAILAAVVSCVDDALSAAGLSRDKVAAAGIGSPGPLDTTTGTILFSANLNVKNYPIGPELKGALGWPILVRNDVRVGAYAELCLGAGRGYRNVIAAFVGTGIGGCVIQAGEIVSGVTGNAGEIGHMIVKAGGPRCGCGARGCLEALASKTAIARRVEKAVRKGLPTVLAEKMTRRGGRLKSRDLAEAVAAKDLVALKEVQRAAHYLGLAVGSLINLLGPELVMIGGGVAGGLGEPFVELVRTSARAQAITDPDAKIRIERTALGDNAGLLGAALLAREQLLHT
jgi:glucokinase